MLVLKNSLKTVTKRKRPEDKLKAGQPTKYKPEYCQMLIDHMKEGYSFFTFAAVLGVNPDTVYNWVNLFPEFSEAKRTGLAASVQWWEQLWRAGAAGQIPNYNATSVIFALKNKAPEIYKDRHEIKTTHEVKVLPMSPKEVKEIVAQDPFLLEDNSDNETE